MDEELLRLWATRRDREAADRLIRLHERALFAFALRLARSQAEASEIVQETFLKVLQKAAAFEGRSSLRTWIFGIAVNVARSRRFRLLRLQALFRSYDAKEHDMGGKASDEGHAILGKVDEALAALPRESRVPILLHYYQGFDYEQIGEILGCPPGTVASRLHAARKKLEARLRRSGIDLAALGSLEMLRNGGDASLPTTLERSLRGLPQKALAPTFVAPVTGLGAAIAGGAAAIAILGSAYFLSERIAQPSQRPEWTGVVSSPAAFSSRSASSSFSRTAARLSVAHDCRERFLPETSRRTIPATAVSGSERRDGVSQESLELRISGTLRDAEKGIPDSCTEIVLRAVWPPRSTESAEPFSIAKVKTDADGGFSIVATGLAAGVYELASAESFVVPHCIALRESATMHRDLLRIEANEEERSALLQSYRAELERMLATFFLETGQSGLSLHLLDAERDEPQIFVYGNSGARIEPLAVVFQPMGNDLLIGPLPAGAVRVELQRPGKSTAILPDVAILERELTETSASPLPADDFFSIETVDAAGSPVADARVELHAADLWCSAPFAAGATDISGKICFETVPCRVNVRVLRSSGEGKASVPWSFHCDQATSGTTLRLTLP